ncbi:MAG: hypothetical protein LBJ17_04290 [Dysgonamonadaceae bacterium]|jgi:hypothetical protein|nr:hypothetical protein [Dysgonamonadaceae bacterium]
MKDYSMYKYYKGEKRNPYKKNNDVHLLDFFYAFWIMEEFHFLSTGTKNSGLSFDDCKGHYFGKIAGYDGWCSDFVYKCMEKGLYVVKYLYEDNKRINLYVDVEKTYKKGEFVFLDAT